MALSEEDIRSKIVLTWLRSCGFRNEDLNIEHTFNVPLGKGSHRIGNLAGSPNGDLHPRADLLVRHVDGRNLLIIEVKAPNERLDERARQQGISYARLLQDGGIPPFVILTNGVETQIFDAITCEQIRQEAIPLTHRAVLAGFRVTSDVAELRAEALERLITLNAANLIEFCTSQVGYRLSLLRGVDANSGRKYIPELYVERKQAQQTLSSLLEREARVSLVVGPPQVGKTNVMCRTVEDRLSSGLPTLFYSASAIGGLLEELTEDFEWIFSKTAGGTNEVAQRLARIMAAAGKSLAIFIDGWNEASQQAALDLERAISRLNSARILFVVSLTDIAAERLLRDRAGNPSPLLDSIGVHAWELPLFRSLGTHRLSEQSVVRIGHYDDDEVRKAYGLYSSRLNVKVPYGHKHVRDPPLAPCGHGWVPRGNTARFS